MSIRYETISTNLWWNDNARGKLKFLEKYMSQCHFVHHKSKMDWTAIETRPPQWQDGNWPPQPRHIQVVRRKLKALGRWNTWPWSTLSEHEWKSFRITAANFKIIASLCCQLCTQNFKGLSFQSHIHRKLHTHNIKTDIYEIHNGQAPQGLLAPTVTYIELLIYSN